jgi:AraC-like DNA-binding protein
VGDRHSNTVGSGGARVLALLPDPRAEELLGACAPLLDSVHHWRHGGVAGLGRRLALELRSEDAAARLALEGLALEALALGLRSGTRTGGGTRPPAWVRRGVDLLHDRFLERIDLLDLARELGVDPQRLSVSFRAAFGVSPGTSQRRLCLDWAARQLIESELPIGTVALRAGFYDQAHFTRQFRRHTGETPGAYRRLRNAQGSGSG